MPDEIQGQSWGKEVKTFRDENDRLDFYHKYAERRLQLKFDLERESAMAQVLSGAGLTTLEQLRTLEQGHSSAKVNRGIAKGETMYAILKDYFKALGFNEAQAKREVDSALPWMQKQLMEQGSNIDKIYAGWTIAIGNGEMSFKKKDGTSVAEHVTIKPSMGGVSGAVTKDAATEGAERTVGAAAESLELPSGRLALVARAMEQAKAMFSLDFFKTEQNVKQISMLTDPWEAWGEYGIFKNDKSTRLALQKLWDRDDPEDRTARQMWRYRMCEWVQGQLVASGRKDAATIMERVLGEWEVGPNQNEPHEALQTAQALDAALADSAAREALATRMTESQVRGSFQDAIGATNVRALEMKVVVGNGLLSIQEGMWDALRFKNIIFEGNRMYALMENGCKGNLVIVDLSPVRGEPSESRFVLSEDPYEDGALELSLSTRDIDLLSDEEFELVLRDWKDNHGMYEDFNKPDSALSLPLTPNDHGHDLKAILEEVFTRCNFENSSQEAKATLTFWSKVNAEVVLWQRGIEQFHFYKVDEGVLILYDDKKDAVTGMLLRPSTTAMDQLLRK